jgi:predicted O-methyltransferase YrrM
VNEVQLPRGYEPHTFRTYLKALYASLRFKSDDFRRYQLHWDRISGWLTIKQAEWLFQQGQSTTVSGDIVEIGSAYGRSTVCLAWGARLSHNGKVYAVDPHIGGRAFRQDIGERAKEYTSLDLFEANIRRFNLKDYIVPVVATSEDAAKNWKNNNVRLVFVDGWHSYDAVKHDILAWSPFVKPGGIIALHDYQMEDIRQAVHDSLPQLGLTSSAIQEVDKMLVYFHLPQA